MRIVVTGGAGFIGSHLVDALTAAGHEVHVIDDLSTGRRENLPGAAELHVADVAADAAADLVRGLRPAAVLHLAAQSSVARSVASPLADMRVNVAGTLAMIDAASEVGSRFVLASTAAVYGAPEAVPVSEQQPPHPASPYAASKLAGEHYLGAYAAQRGLLGSALRYANVYGPRQRSDGEGGVVAVFAAALAAGRAPIIEGDGRQTRDFIHVADVVRANLAVLEAGVVGVFNVSTGRETDILSLFRQLRDASGRRLEPLFGTARPADPRRSALDPAALQRALGFVATVDLRAGLRATYGWFAGLPEAG